MACYQGQGADIFEFDHRLHRAAERAVGLGAIHVIFFEQLAVVKPFVFVAQCLPEYEVQKFGL